MPLNRGLVLGGVSALIVGLFCPIVTVPFAGNLNLFNGGTNFMALIILGVAVLAGAMALNNRETDAFWPGLAAAAVLVYVFGDLQFRLSELQQNLAGLKNSPFGGVAQAAVATVQFQWGWLVLAAGAGFVIYGGFKARREESVGLFGAVDGPAKTVAIVSALLAIGAIGWSVYRSYFGSGEVTVAAEESLSKDYAVNSSGIDAERPSGEEAAYIRDSLELYDLNARYYETYDGKKPGVNFKIKNKGNRTLNKVEVRVIFKDANGQAISEDNYMPVLVSDYSIGDSTPLRPNYIWQNEAGKFYVADTVPSEWAAGQATATITSIEFAPDS